MSVLSIQNLTLSFGENTLFSDAAFDIKVKEKVGFVGVNGAGKTSLFKVIKGDYTADSGGVFLSKSCRVGYMEQHACSEARSVWSELISVFDTLIKTEKEIEKVNSDLLNEAGNRDEKILEQERLTEFFHRNGGLTYKSVTRSALLGLGFSEAEFDKNTNKLSGGQRSKLILAKLLLSGADLLLLDEPTNHLDISAVEWLEGFLSEFSGACLIISHDRYFLDRVTNKTIELENKKLHCFSGNYSTFLVKKEARQKAIFEKYENDRKEIERIEGIIEQQRRWNREKNIKTAESKEKVIERIKAQMVIPDKMVERIRFNFTPRLQSGEDVLQCDGLCKKFASKTVFENVTFDIKKGERIFLLGDNGSGKTTLLKILMGDYLRDDGCFKIGANVQTGYFDQIQAKLDLNKPAIEEVWSAFPQMTETRVRNALAAFLFKGDQVFRKLELCSGGERARVALLKLMLGGYNFLLLDEPTNHLDSLSREELENTLQAYEGTMLIVSHDRYFINKLATRILELTPSGVNDFHGNYDYYLDKRNITSSDKKTKTKKSTSNDYKIKKERAASLRKLNTQIIRLEEEIECIEAEITALQEKLSSSSYEDLMMLTGELDSQIEKRDSLYIEWETVSEKLTLLEI